MILNTQQIQILTPSGFQDFDGIIKKKSLVLRVRFTDNASIRVTPNHQFLVSKTKYVSASELKPRDIVTTKQVVSVCIDQITDVYDPVNVAGGNEYLSNGLISHNCTFLGSANTLIDGAKLSTFPLLKPTQPFEFYDETMPPVKGGNYVMTVDTSRGADLDYSACVIFDISVIPYKIVAKYRCNTISTLMFPEVVHKIARRYSDAFVLIETNDLGQQVADILFYDLEYENVYMSVKDTVKEGGVGSGQKRPGIRTTKRTKSIGCATLKTLIESDHLQIFDSDIINEFHHFVRAGTSFKAEEGYHDDLAMCCVMFAFLTQEAVFKQLFDFSLRHEFIKQQLQEFEEQLEPIGFLDNGIEDKETPTVYMGGDLWIECDYG